ncbi:MAG: uroporphyrinogen-III decarboxylase [Spirochaetes bacterium]|nr:MAG: uroporphyrinogen-III decarboxylase [Spirochaetota bacterium]
MTPYEEKLKRIRSAIALEPVDKVPFVTCGTAINAKIEGVKLSNYITDMELNCSTNINAQEKIGGVDAVQQMVFDPRLLPILWFTRVKVPGIDLSDDELWQMDEKELVKQEDYDFIIKKGFGRWLFAFITKRLGNPSRLVLPYLRSIRKARARFIEAGYPCIAGPVFSSPFEMFCGGRSLETFFAEDLMEIPDKLERVFRIAHRFNKIFYRLQLKILHPFGAWIGGWRGTPGLINRQMFERFSWSYMRDLAEFLIEKNVVPIFHLDSNWEAGLHYFRELPRGKCIMALDGSTNILKAKAIVGDTMCIMGDVPAGMLAFGTPEQVYEYCTRLIREIGPKGFILSSGCDIPFNAKLENIRMMGKACRDAAG